MMNFEKDRIEKLRRTDEQHRSAADLMIPGETSIGVYKGSDFQVTFTDRKVLIVNVRGITGKKIDVTVIPYSKVDIFSVEGHGDIGNDGALVLRVRTSGSNSMTGTTSWSSAAASRSYFPEVSV